MHVEPELRQRGLIGIARQPIANLTEDTVAPIHDVKVNSDNKSGFVDEPCGSPGRSSNPPISLSNREKECLTWGALGKTSWETGKILDISERTVNFHLKNAIEKLNASNRTHAVAISVRLGLINI